jgi:hypothetical protein
MTPEEELQGMMRRIWAMSVADPMPAVQRGLRGRPGRLILVTGQALSEEQFRAIEGQLGEQSKTRLDVVLVDLDSAEIRKWVKGLGGSYTSITAGAVNKEAGAVEGGEAPAIGSVTDEESSLVE